METTNSVIVYRSPLEKQMWESGTADRAIMFIVAAMLWAIIFSGVYPKLEVLKRNNKLPKFVRSNMFIGTASSSIAVLIVYIIGNIFVAVI